MTKREMRDHYQTHGRFEIEHESILCSKHYVAKETELFVEQSLRRMLMIPDMQVRFILSGRKTRNKNVGDAVQN